MLPKECTPKFKPPDMSKIRTRKVPSFEAKNPSLCKKSYVILNPDGYKFQTIG